MKFIRRIFLNLQSIFIDSTPLGGTPPPPSKSKLNTNKKLDTSSISKILAPGL